MIRINRIYLVLMFISGITALLLQQYTFFFLFFLLLLLLIISTISLLIYQNTTSIRFEHKKGYFYAGDTLSWNLIVDNLFSVPYAEIQLKERNLPRDSNKSIGGAITSFNNCRIENSFIFPSRGSFALAHCDILLSDIFKIATLRITHTNHDQTRIYPRLYGTEILFHDGHDIYRDELDRMNGRENPALISDIRPYVQGDSIKKVHWKQSARQDELQVKNYEKSAGNTLRIAADLNKSNYDSALQERGEEAIIDLCASILYGASRRLIQCELLLNNQASTKLTVSDSISFNSQFEKLVDLPSDGTENFSQWINTFISDCDRMTRIIIITLTLDKKLVQQIETLINSSYKISVISIIPNDSTAFPVINANSLITDHNRIYL